MKYDERLIGHRPSDEVLAESKKRLDAMFKKRFEDLQAQRKEQRRIEAGALGAMRNLVKEDPKLAAAVEEAKKHAAARSKVRAKPPERTKVEGRQHLGSVAVTLVPPFWPWQWKAQTGKDAAGVTDVDPNAGTMRFLAYTGNNGKTAAAAVALGGYFQPLADNGVMNVSATPSVSYDEDIWFFWDSAHAGNFIGIYVGQFTRQGEFIQAVIDQRIHIGDGIGSTSGFPLVGSTPCDSDHFYEIWVWAGGDAEADGWSPPFGSAALSYGNITVPSITVFAF
jgi:hypothetical protein